MPSTDLADHLADALLHLARRLVGEGDGEDFGGPGAAEAENVGDAGGEDARLAGARAGQHQHRAVERFDRLALLGVKPLQIGRLGHGARARGNAVRRGCGGRGAGACGTRIGQTEAFPDSLQVQDATINIVMRARAACLAVWLWDAALYGVPSQLYKTLQSRKRPATGVS